MVLSFHVARFFYSKLCSSESFKAKFANPKAYVRLLNIVSFISLAVVNVPIIAVDLWALSQYAWGS